MICNTTDTNYFACLNNQSAKIEQHMPRKSSKETDLTITATGAAARRQPPVKSRTKRATVTTVTVDTPAIEATSSIAEPLGLYRPAQEEIAKLAFLYWEARGCQGGSPEEDWLRAERELSTRSSAATA
jgi:hypothetical protein